MKATPRRAKAGCGAGSGGIASNSKRDSSSLDSAVGGEHG
jgi:hypothetical protein